MKNIFLSLLMLMPYFSFSQELTYYLNGKLSTGASFITNNTENLNTIRFALGTSGGIGASILIDEKVGIDLGIMFGNHSAKYRIKQENTTGETIYFNSKISMMNTKIPILAIISNEEGFFAIGPQLNFISGQNFSSSQVGGLDQDVSMYFSNFSWSGVLETSKYYTLGRRKPVNFTSGVKVNYGLTNIEGVDPLGVPYSLTNNNSRTIFWSINLIFGLQIPLGTYYIN